MQINVSRQVYELGSLSSSFPDPDNKYAAPDDSHSVSLAWLSEKSSYYAHLLNFLTKLQCRRHVLAGLVSQMPFDISASSVLAFFSVFFVIVEVAYGI